MPLIDVLLEAFPFFLSVPNLPDWLDTQGDEQKLCGFKRERIDLGVGVEIESHSDACRMLWASIDSK
jgi:hypothetical protein